jgi:uncharacterized membrane protein YcaP (DUF421 family)
VLFTYAFLLVLLRISGKRVVAEGTPLDFVTALIVGDMIDNVFWGEASAAAFVAGCGAVIVVHLLLSMAEFASRPIHELVNGKPCLVVADGAVNEKGCRTERLSHCDVYEDLRMRGESDLREVGRLTIEPSGAPGVLKHPWAREAQKADADRLPTQPPEPKTGYPTP